ncbi:sensor histidine kinase [Sediminibacterium soli]|uniref:sensor histidine kinase n=1 Tax=Sediminibacterium soli TaxID=2698829 RepID=UPI00137A9F49|nr:HAMP domain-containing sensor histidine kinase [Sediminibacterium soli]NCI45047.1 HAMP domain-containing histidine kinase [Sediminibacterium soli]
MSKPLLQKNTKYLLTWLPMVLLGCSVLFFLLLRMQAHHMQDKQLQLKQRNVWSSFTGTGGAVAPHVRGEYDIVKRSDTLSVGQGALRDTSLYYPDRAKLLPFETLTSRYTWNGDGYEVTVYVSSTEISHLIVKVFIAEAVILLLLLVAIVVLNRNSAKRLWQPFSASLQKMENYDITRNQPLDLTAETGITEFNALHKVIGQLVDRSNSAYNNQKQFVENASHEMQTPLAIIRSKLELLINEPGLTEKNAAILQHITEANDRLSLMNRTLLLLARIENNQFPETETVNISNLLPRLLADLQQYYDSFPSLESNIAANLTVVANRSLIEILLYNLLTNAVVHNTENGRIRMTLEPSRLSISNTGKVLQYDPETLFERFRKDSYSTKTTGLGLALVKEICILYGYTISYEHSNGWHTVSILFA